MKKFWALLKVSVKSMLLTTTGKAKGKKRVSGVGAMVLLAFVALYLSVMYSNMLLGVLAPLDMEVLVFIYMGLGALFGGLFYTVFAVKGVVFGGKDNDLLLSMPVSSTMLMLSRVVAIYLENLCFAFFVLVPAAVSCAIWTHCGSVGFWVRVVLAAAVLPLLDTALSVLVGALLAFLSAKVPAKGLGQHLFMAIFLVVVFGFSFNLNGILSNLAANAGEMEAKLSWAMPIVWMANGILYDWVKLLWFGLCSVVLFVLMVVILGKCYRKAVTAFQSRAGRSDYKLSRQNSNGQVKALLRKELRRFFGNAGYFWNAGLGLILLLAAGIAAVVKADTLREYTEMIPAFPVAAGVMGFCLSTCIITAPSISLEGRYFWILREAPLAEGRLIWAKVGFQLLLSIPCTLICCVCLKLALLSSSEAILLVISMVIFAVGQACFGMLMGLSFPKMDAANEMVVIKQSLASLLSLFIPMLALAAIGVVYALVGMWVALTLLVVLSGACVVILKLRGPAMIGRL